MFSCVYLTDVSNVMGLQFFSCPSPQFLPKNRPRQNYQKDFRAPPPPNFHRRAPFHRARRPPTPAIRAPRGANPAGRRSCTCPRGPSPWFPARTPEVDFLAVLRRDHRRGGRRLRRQHRRGSWRRLARRKRDCALRAACRARACVQVSCRLHQNSSRYRRKRSPK